MKKAVVSAAVMAVCVGCSPSDSTQPDQRSAETSPALTIEANEDKLMEPEREKYLRENIISIAEEHFPDDTGLEWIIHAFTHKEHLTIVEVEPKPDTVGYTHFKFVVSFKDANAPMVVATYCLEDGHYTLLSTIENLTEDLPKALP